MKIETKNATKRRKISECNGEIHFETIQYITVFPQMSFEMHFSDAKSASSTGYLLW